MIAANSIVILKVGEGEVVCCGNTSEAFRRDCDVGANGIDRVRRQRAQHVRKHVPQGKHEQWRPKH